MQNIFLSSISLEDLGILIEQRSAIGARAEMEKLFSKKNTTLPLLVDNFKYIPIQDIFKKKICSKPTFYDHLKKGDFTLYKFGNKSFVDSAEFLTAFHKVKLNNKNVGSNP